MSNKYRKYRSNRFNTNVALISNNNINKINSINDFTNLKTEKCNSTPSVIPAVGRIIAIGDIHGDMSALLYSLKKAAIIDANGIWMGGNDIVVQVGDVLDRGGRGISVTSNNNLEELEILYYLYKLNKNAREYGGRVISLIGNHELMNMLGDFRYSSNEHISGLGGVYKRRCLFKPGGSLAKKIACNSLGIVKIGDWLFVHGGFLPEHAEYALSKDSKGPLERINNLVNNILIGTVSLDSISQQEEEILFGRNGMFWTRNYSSPIVSQKNCNDLLKTMSLLDINKNIGGMVVGHTPQNHINSQCNNKIWRIDTGMSEAFGKRNNNLDRIEVLEILDNGRKINII